MVVHTESDAVKKAQDGVLEFLLINHPLDCPVCDRGGECPLQDQTLAFGPGESRFVEEKRHFEKPIPISDLVLLDRERCILCGRCTRFADRGRRRPADLLRRPGQRDAGANTFPDDRSRRTSPATPCRSARSARSPRRPTASRPDPWDLEQVESTCTTCAVGCRGRGAVVVEPPRAPPRRRRRAGQPRLALRQGPLRLRGDQLRRPPARSAGRATGGELVEVAWARGARAGRGRGLRGRDRARSRRGRACSAARGSPTRTRTPGPAGQGRPRHRQRRRSARRRSARRARARPAPCHDRRGLPGRSCRARPDLKEELPVLYLRLREAVEKRGRASSSCHRPPRR